MARKWNAAAIPDSVLVPDGAYLVDIENLEEAESKSGKFMYKGSLRIAEGAVGVGLPMFEYFVMGTDTDKQWQDPATAGPGARNFKNMLKKAGVDISNEDVDECIATAVGQRVGVIVAQETDDGTADPKYAGTIRNRITAWFSPGERELGAAGTSPNGTRAAARAPAPAPRPAAPAPAAARPAPAPAPRPVAAPKSAADGLRCSICNGTVERKYFKAHVDECEEGAHSGVGLLV